MINMKTQETLAALSVLAVIVAVPILINRYHNDFVLGQYPQDAKIITITGVAEHGAWTTEKVNAGNHWRKKFASDTIYLEEGDQVVLRFQSSDVHHRFYVPALGIGPIEVEPGHTEVVQFKADSAGTYRYYCTSMCGDCHFYMSGWIVVTSKKGHPETPELATVCDHDFTEPPREDMIRWGNHLYREKGCVTCHGKEGRGNVLNYDYIKKTVPAHNTMAEKFHLDEQEDAEAFIELLLSRADLTNLKEQPDIPRFQLVLTQYQAAKDLIVNGKHCVKLDPKKGVEPPLQMPAWKYFLSEYDIDSIIAYMLTLYPWEEEEE